MFIGDTMKRNKLNNRGFAISTALYGLLTLTILILVLIFQVNRTGSNNSKELGEQIQDELDICRKERITYNKTKTDENLTDYKTCIDNYKKNDLSN
jgi:hypothetical protein